VSRPAADRTTLSRRAFLGQSSSCLGGLALLTLLGDGRPSAASGVLPAPHVAPRARRVISLFMSGGPSHVDLFDPKPELARRAGQDLPPSVRGGQRLSGMTSGQCRLPLVGAAYPFRRCGRGGVELSELLPYTAQVIDDLALVRSVHTEPVTHEPAMMLALTGSAQPGRPSMGSWLSYGLGAANANLPVFVVLVSGTGTQALHARYWGNGFLPGGHQGVPLRPAGDPVLYLSNPPGIDVRARRDLLDGVQELNRQRLALVGDPEIATRIAQYEMAFRMQASVPELMDLSREPPGVRALYGAEPGKASFANNCLLACRLAERGVRFIQLFHREWDHHADLPAGLKEQCRQTDRASAALVADLKRRGLLDDTLVVWGGEFGRTAFCQGKLTTGRFGRDHHPRCFSMWLAGGGIRPGVVLGKTDDFGYNIEADPVHIQDVQATLLRCLGIDHKRLTFRFHGRDFRLTDVRGEVVPRLLA
jgi:hypothetical protein